MRSTLVAAALGIVGALLYLVGAEAAPPPAFPTVELRNLEPSGLIRVDDPATGVVCYVVPYHWRGLQWGADSQPAISCVRP